MSNALQHFRSDILGRAVLVRCDNATVVAYINHQGGTRSGHLCALAWDLIHWCIRHGVTLSAVHLPGEENVIADALSRGWIIPTEWSLLPQVARSLFLLIDRPHVDLFASRANNQLPIYCTRRPDPGAWQIDVLLAYAFPPFSLIPRVLAKIEQENCRVLFKAPFWPCQPWFPRLINLLVHRPVILPRRADILYQPSSGMLHPAPGDLHLTCWVQVFHDELQCLRPTPGGWCRQRSLHPPTTSVGEVGDFLLYLFDSGLKTATVKNTDPPFLRSMKVSRMDPRSQTTVRSVDWSRGCLLLFPLLVS